MSSLNSNRPIARRQQPAESKSSDRSTIVDYCIDKVPDAKVQIIPIGGLCEIGKNTWAIRYEDQIVIIDAGLAFPSDDMPGVDLVLPELTYLIENRDKIAGMIITHGHEDHIGGVSNVLRNVDVPIIYGPPLAIGLLEGKLKEAGLLAKANMKRFKPRDTIRLGNMAFTFTRNNHSIPDSFGLIIQTPAGLIVHTGDFKFDFTPVDGELFDIAALAEASLRGVELLISDSTNAEKPGFTPSEKQVYPYIEEAFVRSNKRIIITTFASQVHRIRQILEIAQKYGRKVAILGRSMLNIALVSRQLGYMNFPDGLLIRADEASSMPLNKVVILTTGSQGEPLSALTRIANGTHKQISIVPGDTVIVSATPIPGNERSVASTINALFSRGAQVVYGRDAGVHVSGHCSQEEQKLMLRLVKPKYFLPAHGEYRMLVMHGLIANESCGIPKENVFIMSNGDVLEMCNGKASIVGEVPAGIIMIDSSNQATSIAEKTIKDRQRLSTEGMVSVVVTADRAELLAGPEVVFKGLVLSGEEEQAQLQGEIKAAIRSEWTNLAKMEELACEEAIRKLVQGCLSEHKQQPLVQVMLMQILAA